MSREAWGDPPDIDHREEAAMQMGAGTYCCGDRLKPCTCGADAWKSLGDLDNGDWCEESFLCQQCKKVIYVELPD